MTLLVTYPIMRKLITQITLETRSLCCFPANDATAGTFSSSLFRRDSVSVEVPSSEGLTLEFIFSLK